MRHPWQRRRPRRYLTFSPLAWLKLQFFCHAGDTEIGGFGISAQNNHLYVEDFVTLKQETSAYSVYFDDTAVADHFDRWVDAGYPPYRFSRLWLHTHPGNSALPSSTDEETFRRVFGENDWAVMGILSRAGHTYARIGLSAGPGSQERLRWRVDWRAWAQLAGQTGWPSLAKAWQEEFHASIHPVPLATPGFPGTGLGYPGPFQGYGGSGQYHDSLWEPGLSPDSDSWQGFITDDPLR